LDGGERVQRAGRRVLGIFICRDGQVRSGRSVQRDVRDQRSSQLAGRGGGGKSVGGGQRGESSESNVGQLDRNRWNHYQLSGGALPRSGLHQLRADRHVQR